MKLDVEKKLIITVGIFLIVASVVAITIVAPTVKQINDINRDTKQLRIYMEKKHENIMGIRQTKIKAEEVKEEVFSFINYFYYPERELKLITELEGVSAKNQIEQKINNYVVEGQTVKLSLSTTGDYQNSINYLNELENLNYFLKIDFLHLNQEQNRNDKKPITKMNLELSLYVNTK